MGGDNAPRDPVLGALEALEENKDINVVLIGKEDVISNLLKDKKYDANRLSILHASEVIENDDSPIKSIKRKTDSSLVVGMELVRDGEVDVLVSAGNTGAIVAGGSLIVGRIAGVERPALTTILPTAKNYSLMLDVGANSNCRPINYLQFALMGWLYMSEVDGRPNPSVRLLNIGAESHKGTDTVKKSYKLLKKYVQNFQGNIEGREIIDGDTDIIVSDGFSGNVAVKVMEGTAMYVASEFKRILMSKFLSKLMALSVAKPMRALKNKMDYAEYGGAPLLGVDGKVIKTHGSSNVKAFKNAIAKNAVKYAKSNIITKIAENISSIEYDDIEEI